MGYSELVSLIATGMMSRGLFGVSFDLSADEGMAVFRFAIAERDALVASGELVPDGLAIADGDVVGAALGVLCRELRAAPPAFVEMGNGARLTLFHRFRVPLLSVREVVGRGRYRSSEERSDHLRVSLSVFLEPATRVFGGGLNFPLPPPNLLEQELLGRFAQVVAGGLFYLPTLGRTFPGPQVGLILGASDSDSDEAFLAWVEAHAASLFP